MRAARWNGFTLRIQGLQIFVRGCVWGQEIVDDQSGVIGNRGRGVFMIAIRLSDMIEALRHLATMKRGPSGRVRAADRAILRPSSRGLEVDLPGGGTIIPVDGGHFEREVSIMVPALDALHRGLSKYKQENPVVILSAADDHVLVHCEALKVKIPFQT